MLGMYQSFRLRRLGNVLSIILRAGFTVFIVFGCLTYIFKIAYISRTLIAAVFLITIALLTVEKVLLLIFLQRLRSKGFNFRNILIVGTGDRAKKFVNQVNLHKEYGIKILGVIDEDESRIGQDICGYKVVGDLGFIPDILLSTAVDHVIFIVPRASLDKIQPIILTCETLGVSVSIAVDFFQTQFTKPRQDIMLGMPLLTFETTSDKHQALIFKRIIDIIVSAFFMIILAPLFLCLVIIIQRTSEGPAIFSQERCSVNGRRFKLFKFRTMVKDAEGKLKELMAHNQMEGPAFKMDNDPRITPIGKFLRKFSLDELPQFYNVLKGDMSLIGPRPPLPSEVEKYDFWQRRRLSMRPGLTCLWQVSGRNKIKDFDEWARLDLKYIDEWSPMLDTKIFFKTIPTVLFAVGAK
jgi:exopolysaccharide biosynthesis polyprenyl glycosylphosphotransferase